MRFLRFVLWPVVKVRLRYWWWIVRYGGKKNIPPEVIFRSLEESMLRMADNLNKAFRAMPADESPENARKIVEAMRMSGELRRGIGALRDKDGAPPA